MANALTPSICNGAAPNLWDFQPNSELSTMLIHLDNGALKELQELSCVEDKAL